MYADCKRKLGRMGFSQDDSALPKKSESVRRLTG